MVILGVDPGLNATGYGITDAGSKTLRLVTAGDIRPPKKGSLADRLGFIHQELSQIIDNFHPQTAVLEKIFTHQNYLTTATLMGHARGVACLAIQQHNLPLAEYPPTLVKKSLTGSGAASKQQVARMVNYWLQASDPAWSMDATDALALTIVHAHLQRQDKCAPGVGTRLHRWSIVK